MITEKSFFDAIESSETEEWNYDGEDDVCSLELDKEMAANKCFELAKQLAFEFHKYFVRFYDMACKGEDIRDFEHASLEQRWEMFELHIKSKV
jgi:hypothetical protein